jgi:hypothetical protein
MTGLHPSITGIEMPERIARLPRDHRGYPVPWFVAWLDADGAPVEIGHGTPDFRVIRPGAMASALRGACWICGGRLGANRTFVIGPMCAVNRNSAEPPSHHACAHYAARACPFLARPHARRRENAMPGEAVEAPGIMLRRNPGVTLLWTTRRYHPYRDPITGGVLFEIGVAERVEWIAEGRAATRDEVMASIDSGLPALREVAEQEGPPALRELDRYVAEAMPLVPA